MGDHKKHSAKKHSHKTHKKVRTVDRRHSRPKQAVRRSGPQLKSMGWSPKKLLGICQGDCDTTHHCKKGLVCFTRGLSHTADLTQSYAANPYQKIPGCGNSKGMKNMDYCVKPRQLRTFLKSIRKYMSKHWIRKTRSMTKAWKIRIAKHKKAASKKLAAHRRRMNANKKRAHAKRMAYLRSKRANHLKRVRAHKARRATKHRRNLRRLHAKRRAHAKRMSAMRRAAYLKNKRMTRQRNLRRRRNAYNRKMKAMRAKKAALRRHLRLSRKVVKAAPAPACSTCAAAAP